MAGGRDRITDRRHGVRGRQGLDCRGPGQHHLPQFERHQGQHRRRGLGQPGEVGPDHAVEDVRAQRRQRGRQRVHLDRRPVQGPAGPRHAVGQQADGQHVVEVGMGDEDVIDLRHLVEREVADAGSGVDQHVVVDEEGGRAAAGRDRAGTTEYADPHGAGGLDRGRRTAAVHGLGNRRPRC